MLSSLFVYVQKHSTIGASLQLPTKRIIMTKIGFNTGGFDADGFDKLGAHTV